LIGVDTNVLVRYFIEDDPAQSRRVDALLARPDEICIDDVVLCELVWVLRSGYRFDRKTIAEALRRILATAKFSFDDRDLLRRALADYMTGNGDFSDYVIGQRNARAGCENTVTFDRALRDNPAFRILA
jgi:predicted nucleic-acid-binding protein